MRNKTLKKMAVLAFILGIVLLYKFSGIGDYLSLSYIKESQIKFEQLYAGHRALVIASYVIIYILVTSLSLPGAAVMTVTAGSLFGLWTGTIVVSFASSIGSTVACSVSRFVLRDRVESRFGSRLKAVNEGIEREGAFYLFALRLVPVFPFWLINLVMGLTKMPLRTFYWVSQLGMLPGTIVYVNAGKELAKIESLSEIFSPGLVVSFSLLGLFPVAARKLLALYRSKKGS